MKRSFWIAIILLLFSQIHALVCINADGSLQIPDTRDYHFRHHTGHTDYYFYGSNKWAVFFNFKSAYPGIANAFFEIQAARLYFPYLSQPVQIELYSDLDGYPGQLLSSANATIEQNLLDIPFPESHSLEKAWLVVEYTTNMSNRWVAASSGDGTNSYYMNEIGGVQSLNSFSTAGFNCELLFGLLGDFQLSMPDLQLSSFDLEGDLLPGSSLYPSFSLYNHSDQTIHQAELQLTFSKPDSAAFISQSIPVLDAIPPYSERIYDASTSWMPALTLPNEAFQMRAEATLRSEFAENDTLFANNRINRSYQIFSDANPIHVVENFLRLDETEVISILQAPLLSPRHHQIFYYPMLTDSLSNLPSHRRFNWYQLAFIPSTIAMGTQHVIGFRQDYADDFANILQETEASRSFISQAQCDISQSDVSENIGLNLSLQNENTLLYTSQALNLVANARFFVALCRKHEISGSEHFVLERFIAFADTISSSLNRGDTAHKSYSFTLSGVSNQELMENYRIYYWLQENKGGAIHYVNYRDFAPQDFSSNTDAQLPPPVLRIWPNPLIGKKELSIQAQYSGRLSVYNIRGQLIHSQDIQKTEITLNSDIFRHSGIYFIKIQDRFGKTQNQKISIIK